MVVPLARLMVRAGKLIAGDWVVTALESLV